MEFKYDEGDRIRLTEDVGRELPFLMAGATGTIQRRLNVHTVSENGYPAYFVKMDPVEPFTDETELDYWTVRESKMEPAYRFKVGDRVVTSNPGFTTLKAAKGYVQSCTRYGGHNEYRIAFDKNDDLHFMIKEDDLELAE